MKRAYKITIRLTAEEKKTLEIISASEQKEVSEYIRDILFYEDDAGNMFRNMRVFERKQLKMVVYIYSLLLASMQDAGKEILIDKAMEAAKLWFKEYGYTDVGEKEV